MDENLRDRVRNLPKVPGIYKFKNENGKIIYVGKAKNLRNRVSSYFSLTLDPNSKTYSLVQRIKDLDFIEAKSEFDAIILESSLIRKLKPKYNISLKDDKSNLYIVIRQETFSFGGKNVKVKKIVTGRKTDLKKGDEIYGPFMDSVTTKYVLTTVRKIIPFRDCSISKFNKYKKLKSPCLYGHIGLCSKPCIYSEPGQLKHYNDSIASVRKILRGDSAHMKKELKHKMEKASVLLEYEDAKKYRDLLNKFTYITGEFSSPDEYIENPYLVEDIRNDSMKQIMNMLPFLTSIPKRIECYDVSNISGSEAVASMVVATNGRIDKNEYRRFKIKVKRTPDDYEMMREVIRRRLKRELKENKKNSWGVPDLIILDGGMGQLNAALQIMEELKYFVPAAGLAKRFESLVFVHEGQHFENRLEKYNNGASLLIQLRDEAHRFAQKYHHYLRLKKISEN